MAMFHTDTSTGKTGSCKMAKGECPFGSIDEHFTSAKASTTAYKAAQKSLAHSPTLSTSLTKTDARRLNFKKSQTWAPEIDDTISDEIEAFYGELGRSSYTPANKPATTNTINNFMKKLYEQRKLADTAGLYARGAYDYVAEDLGKYGFIRQPQDTFDKLVAKEFPGGLQDVELEPSRLEKGIALRVAILAIYAKPIEEWSDTEMELVLPSLNERNPHFRNTYGYEDLRQAIVEHRSAAIGITKREALYIVWDSMPDVVKDLYPKDLINEEILKLKARDDFPSYYYNSYSHTPMSLKDNVKAAAWTVNYQMVGLQEMLEESKRLSVLRESLTNS